MIPLLNLPATATAIGERYRRKAILKILSEMSNIEDAFCSIGRPPATIFTGDLNAVCVPSINQSPSLMGGLFTPSYAPLTYNAIKMHSLGLRSVYNEDFKLCDGFSSSVDLADLYVPPPAPAPELEPDLSHKAEAAGNGGRGDEGGDKVEGGPNSKNRENNINDENVSVSVSVSVSVGSSGVPEPSQKNRSYKSYKNSKERGCELYTTWKRRKGLRGDTSMEKVEDGELGIGGGPIMGPLDTLDNDINDMMDLMMEESDSIDVKFENLAGNYDYDNNNDNDKDKDKDNTNYQPVIEDEDEISPDQKSRIVKRYVCMYACMYACMYVCM